MKAAAPSRPTSAVADAVAHCRRIQPSVTAALNVVSSAPSTPRVTPPAAAVESQQREKSEILKRLNEKMLPEKDNAVVAGEMVIYTLAERYFVRA